MPRLPLGVAIAAALLAFAAPAHAWAPDYLYGITTANPPHLVAFESDAPGTLVSDRPITGLSDPVVAFDVSPRDGGLYVVTKGTPDRFWILDPIGATATKVGDLDAALTTAPDSGFGADFDPQTGKLRVVSQGTNQNLSIDPANAHVTADTDVDPVGRAIPAIAFHNND